MATSPDLPPGLYRRGRISWVKYYGGGLPMRESTGTAKLGAAKRFLDERRGRVATDAPILPRADKVRYEEIAGDLRTHYASSGARNAEEAEFRLAHLDRFFAGRRVAALGARRSPPTSSSARRPVPRTGRSTANWRR
jgi:hypothetical protein